jgi:hypothetical protein
MGFENILKSPPAARPSLTYYWCFGSLLETSHVVVRNRLPAKYTYARMVEMWRAKMLEAFRLREWITLLLA